MQNAEALKNVDEDLEDGKLGVARSLSLLDEEDDAERRRGYPVLKKMMLNKGSESKPLRPWILERLHWLNTKSKILTISQLAWTTVKKGKGTKRTDFVSDIPSSSTGPLGAPPAISFSPIPVSRGESSSPFNPVNPAIRDVHTATTPPHPGNKFALLSEDLGLHEFDVANHPDIMLDVIDSPRDVPDSNQAQVSPTQSPQHSPQSQRKSPPPLAGIVTLSGGVVSKEDLCPPNPSQSLVQHTNKKSSSSKKKN
ncbi:hypothetical protein U1Q18_032589 [Sarracenia purpurea var. burkii]